MSSEKRVRLGATVQTDRTEFRVWAPRHTSVKVVLESGAAKGEHTLSADSDGYFQGAVPKAGDGDRYYFKLGDKLVADPASRFQPDGPFGSSQIIDPALFKWTDANWKGVSLPGQVLYELHIGTFTQEGTWAAAARELKNLAELGVTVLEVMPVAEFPGRFGWGYDGVLLFAPTRRYGTPDDFRRFVDAAHGADLGVILDVVYNHFGPDGNVASEFSDDYFSEKHKNEWGKPLNFDGKNSGPVREFFWQNAAYWVREYHTDGVRLDATQAIMDESKEHLLKGVQEVIRRAATGRQTIVIHENECQDANMIRPVDKGGLGIDGAWNDDFHHSAMVALTGRNEAYYSDHHGKPQEFISSTKYGYLFQGQRYSWQENRRGSPAFDRDPWQFVIFLQNHDQVPNGGSGLRCHQLTSPGRFRAMTTLLLLSPATPLLFQGQEFAASSPFLYFADHKPDLARQVKQGRAEFLTQFRHLNRPGIADELADPSELSSFEQCKLDFSERKKNAKVYQLHKDLLALRKSDPAFRQQKRGSVDGAVLGERVFVLRFFAAEGGERADRLLLINTGCDLHLDQTPEPLLAPPRGCGWDVLFSSEDPKYGGEGTSPVETLDGWRVMGEAAVVLRPVPRPVPTGTDELMAARKHRERTKLGE
jgi:maltooligosyltrehalose trehalohydrolase